MMAGHETAEAIKVTNALVVHTRCELSQWKSNTRVV